MVTQNRETFKTNRSSDYLSPESLEKQSGHDREDWPLALLKELIDNSLDNAEEIGEQPDVTVTIAADGITVTDQGSGIEAATVEGIPDLDSRISSRAAYQTTTRGSQGNAWPTILGFAYNWGGEKGRITIEAQGIRHEITVSMDRLVQQPTIEHTQTQLEKVQIGTSVKVHVDDLPSILEESDNPRIVLFGLRYAALNPHLRLTIDLFGERHEWKPSSDTWRKWTAAQPDPPAWYDLESFETLLASSIAKDRDNGTDRPLREFLRTFAGLKRSDAQKAVSDETGLSRCGLSALLNCDGLDRSKAEALLKSMQKHGTNPKPEKLGSIGREHINRLFGEVKYKRIVGHELGLPFVVEAAFAEVAETDSPLIITGCNASPAITEPIVSMLHSLLQKQMVEIKADSSWRPFNWKTDSGVMVLLHIIMPAPQFSDWGKGVLSVDSYGFLGRAIDMAITHVTAEWCNQKKREERDAEAADRRVKKLAAMMQPARTTLKEAVFTVIPDAIKAATGGVGIKFDNRDFFYQTRPRIQQYTDEELTQKTFDSIVDQWELENGIIDGLEKDPRGYLLEPHTGKMIPLGTKAVDDYQIPSYLYGDIAFLEKKGVTSKLVWAQIAERYDIAIMASEGYAVRAAKSLLQAAQSGRKRKILCFHDADPDGKNIKRTLGKSSGAHEFNIDICDCGLTLDEALAMGLPTETFTRKKKLPSNLVLSDLEREYWTGEPTQVRTKSGKLTTHWINCRRVELNALSADPHRFIEWFEQQLELHGVKKIVPPKSTILQSARNQRDALLDTLVREEFDRQLDVDSRVRAITARLSKQVQLQDIPNLLKKWAPKMLPVWWKDHVRQTVADRIGDVDDAIVEAVEKSLEAV